jgi:UDP-N-acetylglucosamine 2-epimerase (non-hydrolysing)
MKKISVIIGTRPEAIKMAPLICALRECTDRVVLSVCKTGQHTDMVDSVLSVFGIKADVDFSVMGNTQTLNDTTALLIQKFESYYTEFKPDLVFVQGDTTSVFAGALAAFNRQIEVAHVEAGLRTGNLASPWPEEGFRSMVSPITRYHFAPTQQSFDNLIKAGIPESNIFITGNTVIDALHMAETIIENGEVQLALPEEVLTSKNKRSILITGHRRENFGSGLDNLCRAIARLAEQYADIDFVFPVHLNPVVQGQVKTFFSEKQLQNVLLIPPQPYLEFIWLMKHSLFIITDSGGVQEEAPGLGKPVLVTRDTTERPEGIAAGTVKLVGTDESSLFAAACSLLESDEAYRAMAQAQNPYGDGKAVERILEVIFRAE